MISLIVSALLWSLVVCGQDLSVPSGWRSPTSARSVTERAQIAQTVIDTITPLFNPSSGRALNLSFGQNGHMLSSISLHDFYASSQANNQIITQWLGANADGLAGITNETLTWAVAGANAYRAYGDSRWLNLAVAVWNAVNSGCVITPDTASSGVMTGKNVTVPGQCNGKTTVGGMFLMGSNPTSLLVNMDTMGGFMSLSALLFEATGNQIYGNAMKNAFEFVRAHLFDGQIITDRIDLSTCTVTVGDQSAGCGFVIESLSIYLNKTTDQPTSDFLATLIPTAIKFPGYTSSNGVNSEGPTIDSAETFGIYNAETANKAIFIRGLHEAWNRMDKGSNSAQLIQSYITVQFNALLDLAKASDTDFFSPRWQGPPATKFIPWGQYTATNVMNAALSMALTNTTGTAPPNPSVTGSNGPITALHRVRVGVIVGATIGGVLLVAIIIAFAVIFVRRRRRSKYGTYDGARTSLDGSRDAMVYATTPYTVTSFNTGSQALYSSAESGVPITSPSATVPSSHILGSTEPDSIPDLVYRLNRAMATQLIVTNADVVSSPPEYETVAGNPAQIMPTTKQTSENGS